uniref:Teleost multiple tissue opsin 3a n=1 Tax=Oncorhynchus kisutch TaxID=8019 RepID=A0A8C7DY80_ONCKI
MVVHLRALNFSSTESYASNLSTNVSVRDTLVPQDTLDLSRQGHTVVAVCLGLILVLGLFNNLLVLFIFAKFRSLWTPINIILLNISVSDILVCMCGIPFSFAASFANSLFEIVSLVSLSILSYERYATVQRSTQADVSDFRKAWLCVWGSWLYSLLWTLPPFMGWSSNAVWLVANCVKTICPNNDHNSFARFLHNYDIILKVVQCNSNI